MIKQFLQCGSVGLFLEIFWTGLGSLIHHDKSLKGTSSLIMFPIYGLAFLISPLSKLLKKFNALFRGIIYAFSIFSVEYLSGTILKKANACPWDYSAAKHNYHGVVRFDYLPLWFIVGLIYEKLLKNSPS